jgi:hypothetical protein
MQVSVVLNVHANPAVVLDTIESIQTYMSKDILVVVDGSSTAFDHISLPVPKIKGFPHNVPKSPYRNVALGLMSLQKMYPESQYYCYTEYDCLFTSNKILENLQYASNNDIWMLGSDGHVDELEIPVVESIVKGKFDGSYYLLGACQFFGKPFMDKLVEINFFEKLLVTTSPYSGGFFPLYNGYDISEHMYPTMARYFGGKIGVFSTYDYVYNKWHGNYEAFPIRWKPELDPETENFPNSCIMHPIKTFEHSIREHNRKIRKCFLNLQEL